MPAFPVERDVVRASGPDAASYLHGQLSQEVAALAIGGSARSFLLDPTGKTVAWLRVTRVADDALVLDTDPGFGPAMVARLERFKLRTDCTFELLDWQCVALRGADVPAVGACAGAAEVVVAAPWPGGGAGAIGVDLLGRSVQVPSGVAEGTAAEHEALRVAAGIPVTGIDLAADGIPNEAGRWVIDSSISFTKGCYTGQELVMRIDSRGGNVPHPLRLLDLLDPEPPAGAEVVVDDKAVGRLTSVAGGHALGPISRAVEPGSEVTVRWDDGASSSNAIVGELPTA
jgi:folate-binding protein YgfZ